MKSQINAVITKLQSMLDRAEELADSENDNTSEKYTNVAEIIEEVVLSLQEAVDILDAG